MHSSFISGITETFIFQYKYAQIFPRVRMIVPKCCFASLVATWLSYIYFPLCVLGLWTKDQLEMKQFLWGFGIDLVDPWVLQLKEKGGFFGSKARFLIFIQVQYVITHEQERLKGQIFKHLTVQLLPNLYTHSYYSEHTNLQLCTQLASCNFEILTYMLKIQIVRCLNCYIHLHSSYSWN